MKRFDGPEGLENMKVMGHMLGQANDAALAPVRDKVGWITLLFELSPGSNVVWTLCENVDPRSMPALLRQMATEIEMRFAPTTEAKH